jgi:intracellular sulfur oxidation DsrE/DsrF family protein
MHAGDLLCAMKLVGDNAKSHVRRRTFVRQSHLASFHELPVSVEARRVEILTNLGGVEFLVEDGHIIKVVVRKVSSKGLITLVMVRSMRRHKLALD